MVVVEEDVAAECPLYTGYKCDNKTLTVTSQYFLINQGRAGGMRGAIE